MLIPEAFVNFLNRNYQSLPLRKKARLSEAAACAGVGAVEEDSEDADGRGACEKANEDQVQPLGFATCCGHAHLHRAALSLEAWGLCQGSSLLLRVATQHLGSHEALAGQQHVGGACHHSQHKQIGAACHGSSESRVVLADASGSEPALSSATKKEFSACPGYMCVCTCCNFSTINIICY